MAILLESYVAAVINSARGLVPLGWEVLLCHPDAARHRCGGMRRVREQKLTAIVILNQRAAAGLADVLR